MGTRKKDILSDIHVPFQEAVRLNCYYVLDLLKKIIVFICLFLPVLGLHCCAGFSLVAVSGGYCLVAVLRLLTAVASLVVEHRL